MKSRHPAPVKDIPGITKTQIFVPGSNWFEHLETRPLGYVSLIQGYPTVISGLSHGYWIVSNLCISSSLSDKPVISFHIPGFEKISQYIKRCPGDIFLCSGTQRSRLSVGCHGLWIKITLHYPMSKFRLQTSPVQANAASDTKCSRN